MSVLTAGRPTWVTVNLDALAWNVRQVRLLVGKQKKILAVVKADGYGHGAVACSERLVAAGADQLGVATVEEGAQLRQAGLKVPIVMFGISQPHEAEAIVKLKLQPTVVSIAQARLLQQAAQKHHYQLPVHLKIDTGMGRIGSQPQEAMKIVRQLNRLANIKMVGCYTHFAHADGRDKKLLNQQLAKLKSVIAALKAGNLTSILVHAANSAAVMETPQAYFDMVRPGLMLYGLYPSQRFKKKIKLKPVLSWLTRIVQVKDVPAGTGISYGHTYITKQAATIATLPVGYADGFSRLLSNQGQVLVRGTLCPVVGRVCMDMCMIDVTTVQGVKPGDKVVLIGKQHQQELTADMMAEKRSTIAYEVVTGIGKRVPRLYQRSSV